MFDVLLALRPGGARHRKDVQLKDITRTMLSSAAPAAEEMTRLDGRLTTSPYRLVAHRASTEAGIIARPAEHGPRLAELPLLDTAAGLRPKRPPAAPDGEQPCLF